VCAGPKNKWGFPNPRRVKNTAPKRDLPGFGDQKFPCATKKRRDFQKKKRVKNPQGGPQWKEKRGKKPNLPRINGPKTKWSPHQKGGPNFPNLLSPIF